MHAFTAVLAVFTTISRLAEGRSSLHVHSAPTFVRPYVIEHYAPAQAVALGQQIYRFPVTGASSGGAFSLISTSSPSSSELGSIPHRHQTHHENFFCLKGRFQLWAEDEARLLTVGDYGSIPRNTTHTYQILDPDTEIVGVLAPGGFEDLPFFLADSNYTSSTRTPYVPTTPSNSSSGSPPEAIITALRSLDVYAQLDYAPRTDLVNGSAPSGNGWHTTTDAVPTVNFTPYFVAKDYGEKYLNRENGYQIVQPFVTNVTGGGEFTQGSVTISRQFNATPSAYALPGHTAFEVLEGALNVRMQMETVMLITGDVAFIPANTSFEYWSDVAFTKFMYVCQGVQGLDQQLLVNAEAWGFSVFPTA
ncbi:RmlC-like cupin [Pleomassaria siparia CBS 279.74]|uniref:RmlC-like cupin n=1 Tax=Pleomassaria siparia CBS 279.74 TaxID=1314801 RepID=A0A6G1K2I4_9PLEO|nr:RmlC-like cupin [Pleomassaria siparia CBS 279.74]